LQLLHALCAQEEKQARAELHVHAQPIILLMLQEIASTLIHVHHPNFMLPPVKTAQLDALLVPLLD
jgi:hypothetical protein